MLVELSNEDASQVSGGYWAHVAIAIAVADAAYDFYQGYSDHRR
ncbi:hypothetical protein [Alteromonas sp. KUL49]|nr:hypothetical protein [Alteromonas sp. KUL49]GEA11689.1 hypothetical protein KUL49_20640 [Alteromonas sp. KUL49]